MSCLFAFCHIVYSYILPFIDALAPPTPGHAFASERCERTPQAEHPVGRPGLRGGLESVSFSFIERSRAEFPLEQRVAGPSPRQTGHDSPGCPNSSYSVTPPTILIIAPKSTYSPEIDGRERVSTVPEIREQSLLWIHRK